MKILQAIATSSAQTLEGHKGEGLVCCSINLPMAIQDEARQIGYSPDAGGQAIFSLKRINASAEQWLMINRTVPAIDYGGRTSYVSHSIAIKEIFFLKHFHAGVVIPSIFEFMRRFEWESSWKGDPKWLNDSDDLDASAVNALRPELIDTKNPLDPTPLLAFVYPVGGNPTPKRAIWHFDGRKAEEILEVFHHVWLCLDPWQGVRRYKEHLGEPPISLLDSWLFPFTTNLRHGQSGDYQWIVASPDCPSIPGVDLIEPSRWTTETPDSIKGKIGRPLGDLLVERCVHGPEAWAQSNLRVLLAGFKQDYAEKAQILSGDIKNQVEKIVADFRTIVLSEKDRVAEYETAKWWSFDREQDITEIRRRIDDCENSARTLSGDSMREYRQKADSLIALLRGSHNTCEYEAMHEPCCFPELLHEFEQLAIDYKNACRIVDICTQAIDACNSVNSLKNVNKQLDQKCIDLDRELKAAKKAYDVKWGQSFPTGSAKKTTKAANVKSGTFSFRTWQMIVWIFSIVALASLGGWILGRQSNKDEMNLKLRAEINNLKNRIDNLKGDIIVSPGSNEVEALDVGSNGAADGESSQ